uniref:Uncharacterized protein n=1 Tax=Chromera velia CCMP2878 TaxID=1169474 RepID=A0A0G4HHC5_9ALVE|eukprot:Cvel_27468.t1-p1 / transcript=Cvel_27468.t1 / gene=Cvel_27468 / organism=Chromera_velia_CCMP2878 / gene_product=hypothetical protein / transcript_product=hypothetical protein / location=Cvel_scaffold3430:6215-7562(-) / protein_length=354 / sequence_SO=supercontig / SO=protein_coding / is_pseudo=false
MSVLGLALGGSGCPALQKLDLCWMENGDEGVAGLAEGLGGGCLSSLRDLSLEVTTRRWGFHAEESVGGRGMHRSGRGFEHRQASCSPNCELRLAGLSRGTGQLPALHTLHCAQHSTIGTEGAQSLSALMSGGGVPSLKDLKVNVEGLGQEGFQPLAAALSSPYVSALRVLHVKFRGVGTANAAAEVGLFSAALTLIRSSPQVGGALGWGSSCDRGGLCVMRCVQLSSLRELRFGDSSRFSDSSFGVEGGRALSEIVVAEKLPSLKTLEAVVVALTDGGVRVLIERWTNHPPPPLQVIDLQSNQLTGELTDSLLAFLGSQRISSLETLCLNNNQGIDEWSKQLLRMSFPEVDVKM